MDLNKGESILEEKIIFQMIQELCVRCGAAIDMISKKCNINQTLIAKMFIDTFTAIINKMEKE